MISIQGGVSEGYTLVETDTQASLPLHFSQMWDAINTRNKLNRGEWKLASKFSSLVRGS